MMKRRVGLFALVATAIMVSLVPGAVGSRDRSSGLIAIGSFHGGFAWIMTGTDSTDGHYCIDVKFASSPATDAGSCGSINSPGRYGAHGISFLAHPGRPLPYYVVGPVVATVRDVRIALSNGKVLRPTIVAAHGALVRGINFYYAELPCPAKPMHFVGLNAAGHIVAHLDNPPAAARIPPKLTC
jgi:hypothetical protein